jgi:hypothetical protein
MDQDTQHEQRFIRWQKITMDQLGSAQNLVLTFAVATLGYWFALLENREFIPASSVKCFMLVSLFAISVSAICGLVGVLTRLHDFRGTARRARNDENAPSKETLDVIGRLTWSLFYCQCAAFALGIAAIASALLLTYGGKLA